jgi:ribosomal protein L36
MSRQSSGNPNPTNSRQPLRDEPVKIRAASPELREKDKMATFTGDVYVLCKATPKCVARCSSCPTRRKQIRARPTQPLAQMFRYGYDARSLPHILSPMLK